jgi:transcriptional regulator with XRE-family HTH domain
MVERIQLLLKKKGLSPSQMADQIQVQRSGLSHVLSGRNKPSLDFVLKVLDTFPDINPEWLLHGKGAMNKVNLPEVQKSEIREDKVLKHGEIQFPDLPDRHTISEIPVKQAKPSKPQASQIKENKELDQRREIEKIVILYKDHTFQEYKPNV